MEEAVIIPIAEYEPMTMMRTDAKVLVVGQRRCGKTTMLHYLLDAMVEKVQSFLIVCRDRDDHEEYARRASKRCCGAKRMLFSVNVDGCWEEEWSNSPSVQIYRTLPKLTDEEVQGIVMDDCQFVGKKSRMASRLSAMSQIPFYLEGVQYMGDFSRNLMTRFDTIILYPEYLFDYREKLRMGFLADVFSTDDELIRVFAQLGEHEMLVFDRRAFQEDRRRPFLFYCKAEVLPWYGSLRGTWVSALAGV